MMKCLVVLASLTCAVLASVPAPVPHPAAGFTYYGGVPFAAVTQPIVPAAVAAVAPLVPAAQVYAPAFYGAPTAFSSQFHAQDEFGNVAYGYADPNSAKSESGNSYVGVSGGYRYVDPQGNLQTVNYVADDLGFRVVDSRLPKAPVFTGEVPVGPQPVEETPEVVAARADFAAKFSEVERRDKAETIHSVTKREALSDPQVSYGYNYLPYSYGAGFYTPLLAYHNYRYPYVAGYGPQAYTYNYRQ